jgi:hypothetical protein
VLLHLMGGKNRGPRNGGVETTIPAKWR